MTGFSLRIKFIMGTTFLFLLVGGALGMLVKHELHARLEQEVVKRGFSIARYIAEAAEIPLITENIPSLDLLVHGYLKLDKDIEYIFIVAPDSTVTVHTFGREIPHELVREALNAARDKNSRAVIDVLGKRIYDISIPIQNGALGYVHIGLFQALIHDSVNGVLLRILPFMLGILTVGVLAAVIFASAITRPIALLTRAVKRLGISDNNEPIVVDSHDEIGHLAAAFVTMTEKLRSTTVSRQYMEKLIDNMNDVLIVISPTGLIQSVNRAYCELSGESRNDVVGRCLDDFKEPNADTTIAVLFKKALEQQPVHGIESQWVAASGELVHIQYSLALMQDGSGQPEAVICAAQNISSLKKAQEALQQKQVELEGINRNLEEMVFSRTAELAIGNEGLRAEVAERQKKTEELRAARDYAESANRAKSEFLANMSHEMRTPLNSIIGGTEYLDSTVLGEDQHRCMTMIRHAGDSLLILINDLIDLSRIEAGQLEIVCRPFDLNQTMDRVLEMVEQSVKRKKLSLSLRLEDPLPRYVEGDQLRIQQVLVNLIVNAVKFTGDGGSVFVTVKALATEGGCQPVTFSVKDTGIGIDRNKLDMIFDSFSQADTTITRRFGGSGLGLAISRKLVEAMGGNIQVESIPGEGSTFAFTIPFLPASAEPMASSVENANPAGDQAGALSSQPAGTFKEVLLVDDSLENLELMRLLLRKLPLHLSEAYDGQEALDLFSKQSFDLILMDIQMPVMDGFTATRMMRRLEKHTGQKRCTIIALTAHAYESDIKKCLEAGCDDHIAKPFKKKTLLDSLGKHLKEM